MISALALLALASSCGSPVEPVPPVPPPPSPPTLTGAAPFHVSKAVTMNGGTVAFISLEPGRLTAAQRVTVRNLRTLAAATEDPRAGGLDPLGVPAATGDTIALEVSYLSQATLRRRFVVPAESDPFVLRSEPAIGAREQPVNTPIEVVFSEPLDAAALVPELIALERGAQSVEASITFGNLQQTSLRLTPVDWLPPGADFQLVFRAAVPGFGGRPLGAEIQLPFATAPLTPLPSGRLAFVRDDQIYAITAPGQLLRLTSTLPDRFGRRIYNREPAWSPDGQRLAFVSNRTNFTDMIYLMNADGSVPTVLVDGVSPAWSPDGSSIAYGSRGAIGVFDLAAGPQTIFWSDGWGGYPVWTHGGQSIIFSTDWRAFDFVVDLYQISPTGTDLMPVRLGPFPVNGATGHQFYFQAAPSPDGHRLAVGVCDNTWNWCESGSLGIMNADGTGLQLLAGISGYPKPAWSPDGQTVAFGSANTIRLIDVDGSNERLLVSRGHSPSWRP